MTNFYFGVLLGKDVKKVTDTNDAEAQKKYRTPLKFPEQVIMKSRAKK